MRMVSKRLLAMALILGCASVAAAQTADDVIEKHLTAIGGRAALAKLTSRTTTGTMTLSTPGGDVAGPIEVQHKQPNKVRTVMKLDLTINGSTGQPDTYSTRCGGTATSRGISSTT
jgi:outer membrane lipoprotein-sorting protein